MNDLYRLTAFITIVVVAIMATFVLAADFYKWVDDEGATHFADSIMQVPEKYRNQLEEKKFKNKTPRSTVKSLSRSGSTPSKKRSSGKLKRYAVRYRAYEGSARRIIIPVTFNGSVTAPMLLDTGAPGLVISPNLAERIGVFESDEGKLLWGAGGIGGVVPAIVTIIDSIQVGAARDSFVPAIITRSISGSFAGLIGMDFMSNFSINIDTGKHMLILTERPARPNTPGGHDEAWWRINFHQFGQMRAGWKRYLNNNEKKMSETGSFSKRLKEFAEKQFGEADKLYRKLERYANYNSVPTHWRNYR